jgi:hypothetical protein
MHQLLLERHLISTNKMFQNIAEKAKSRIISGKIQTDSRFTLKFPPII